MSHSENQTAADDRLVEALAREAVSDAKNTSILHKELEVSFQQFKMPTDGSTKGVLLSVLAVLDYCRRKRPDWDDQGLLNPLAAAAECLDAIIEGKSNDILKSAAERRAHNAPELNKTNLYFRGAIAALVDVHKQKTPGHKIVDYANRVASAVSKAGWAISKHSDSDEELQDAKTIIRWRKHAKEGNSSDPDTLSYRKNFEWYSKSNANFGKILELALNDLKGIHPPN